MATLVLSSLGAAVGGPIGGAIGALIGQSIDRSLFAPSARQGPRLGDLSVQTSSYGTPLPRVYGRMRVAGTVVWATDLKESQASVSGGKGQAGTLTSSYSVSIAVALSSRRVSSIGRIWADGKLLRGEAGDFKIRTDFRMHDGGFDQPIDPLIGALEGISATPAYRGLALAVFENLELAAFGNRIPVLTFEVIADAVPISLAGILGDASRGRIVSDSTTVVTGFAAHGSSIADGVGVIVDTFGVRLSDDGEKLRSPANAAAFAPTENELGCGPGRDASVRIARRQDAASTLPSKVAISYYDAARDFQSGLTHGSFASSGRTERAIDLPAVLNTQAAKGLAEQYLARVWSGRDHIRLSLPVTAMALQVGQQLSVSGESGAWSIEKVAIEQLVVTLDLRRADNALQTGMPSDPGRSLPQADVPASPTLLALMDLPAVNGLTLDAGIQVAATRAQDGWSAVPIEYSYGNQHVIVRSAPQRAILGLTEAVLPATASAALIDESSSMVVQLTGASDWLESCDDVALGNGDNLALIGDEVVQFGSAIALGSRRFRLTRFLRGRGGSEWTIPGHAVGERFVLLKAGTIATVPVPPQAIGASLTVKALGIGDAAATAQRIDVGAEALRPPRPVHLTASEDSAGLRIRWVRRSRLGWAWLDEVDAPLGEDVEAYRVILTGAAASIERVVTEPTCLFSPAERQAAGASPVTCKVIQIGSQRLSRSAEILIA